MSDHAWSLYEELMQDPNAQKIEYTISDKYVKELTPRFGIKEIIANFYDQNGEDFEMTYHKKTLTLCDQSTGIDIQYMIIGNSGSRENEEKIGEHGEGFKIGALTLVREGNRFLLDTVGYTLAFGLEYSPILKTNVLYAKFRTNARTKGTLVLFECKAADYKAAKNMFLAFNESPKITDSIIDSRQEKTKSIYLNGLEHAKKTAIFSYNIRQKNQISNRDRNFIEQRVLENEIQNIYLDLDDSDAIAKVMTVFLENKNNFDKQLEAKIFSSLDLSLEQRKMYREALPEEVWYTDRLDGVDVVTKAKRKIIEVDKSLFEFLVSIHAHVLTAELEEEEEYEVRTFTLNPSLVLSSIELENLLVSKILGSIQYRHGTFSIQKNKIFILKMNTTLEERIKKLKFGYQFSQYSSLDDVLIAIFQLATYRDFEVTFYEGNREYELISYQRDGNVYVKIYSKTSSTIHPCQIRIQQTQSLKNKFEQKGKNWIEIAGLKWTMNDSLYSYAISDLSATHSYEDIQTHIRNGIKNMVQEVLKKEEKTFFTEVVQQIQETWIEQLVLVEMELSSRSQKKLQTIFQNEHPKSCLASENKFHNELVEGRFGYQTLEVQNPQFTHWLKKQGIPTAETVLDEKQNEEIITVDMSETLSKAIKIFQNAYQTVVVVKNAAKIPDDKESSHRDGTIYINAQITEIPEYLAALIGYEYEQLIHHYETPSHQLQDRLTHNLLG